MLYGSVRPNIESQFDSHNKSRCPIVQIAQKIEQPPNSKKQLPFLGPLEQRYRLGPIVKVYSHQKLGLRSGVGFLFFQKFPLFLDDEERLRFSSSSLNPVIVIVVVQHFNFYRRKVRIVLCLVILWLGIVNIVV